MKAWDMKIIISEEYPAVKSSLYSTWKKPCFTKAEPP